MAAGREESGNAFLSGRELAIEDALASKAHIDALAVALRRGGLPGTLQQLRVLAFNDLTQGRNPLARLTGPRPAEPASQGGSGSPAAAQESPDDAAQAHDVPCGDAGAGEDDGTGGHDSTIAGDSDEDDASWDGCPDMTRMAARTPRHPRRRRPPRRSRRPARAARTVPRADQPHRPGRHRLRLVHRPRRSRQLGTHRPRRHPPPAPGRLPAPPHPLAPHPARPRRHRRRPRPRPRPPPLDPAADHRHLPSRTRHPAGRRAHRTPARTEHHLHPDRQRQLRPRQPRRPLHPQPQTQSTWSAPAPPAAPPPAAAPRPHSATSTTPIPTPPASPASATSHPPAAATTDASRPPAGS